MNKECHPVANNIVQQGHGAGGGDPHPQRPERLQLLGQLPVQRLDPLIQLGDRGALQGPGSSATARAGGPCKAPLESSEARTHLLTKRQLMLPQLADQPVQAGEAEVVWGAVAAVHGANSAREGCVRVQQELREKQCSLAPPHLHSARCRLRSGGALP